MMCRGLPVLLTLVFFAGLATAGLADEAVPVPAQPANVAGLEKRLADLEKQLAGLMKEVQSIRKELKAQTPKVEIKVFALKHAKAAHVARLLQELLGGKTGKTIHIVFDQVTNSVIIQATPEHLRLVEAVVIRLDEPTAEPKGKASEQAPTKLQARVVELEAELAMRQELAAWSQVMALKGFLTVQQAEADQAAVRVIAAYLEQARRELDSLRSQKDRKPGN
jgi:hypothetical protein